jgi:serine O-acetyltransferase
MIRSKSDYKFYLAADKIALGIGRPKGFREVAPYYLWNEVWKLQRLLRKIEYYENCSTSIGAIYVPYIWYEFHRLRIKLGCEIFPNCFGAGLSIAHPWSIVVHTHARIGENCKIHSGVVIGTNKGTLNDTPKIGNNVFIGSGAKIFGNITIADGIAIGTNSVVNSSFLEPNITIAGVPARKISDKGSQDIVCYATEILRSYIK